MLSPMKSIIVQKYGGACLDTPEKIKAVAASVAKLSAAGNGVIVVVSAMGKTTDGLVKLAYQVSPSPNRRELDMLLTTGERVSMSLMSMALSDLGCRAISFTGSQAGVMTDGSHSNARIVDVRPIRISEELNRGNVIVLAGFQGVNPETKEITTLGRGGTDTTAVAMAAKFIAARCEIIKEVDGVCTADPQIAPTARALPRVTFATLREMCFWGAKVLHYRSVALADETNVNLFIRRWGSETRITEVAKEDREMEQCQILSVSSHANIEHLEIEAPTLNRAYALLEEHLTKNQLAHPQILASAFNNDVTGLMFTGEKESLDTLLRSLNGQNVIRPIKETLSSVTITCHGAVATDLAAKAMAQLERDGIVVDKVLFTPLSLSVCVLPTHREAAVRSLHTLIN
jgi:aspartate kinase